MAKVGRPRTETEAVTVRLPVETIGLIDDARKKEDDLPTRPEMIRRMIADWLNERSSEKSS